MKKFRPEFVETSYDIFSKRHGLYVVFLREPDNLQGPSGPSSSSFRPRKGKKKIG